MRVAAIIVVVAGTIAAAGYFGSSDNSSTKPLRPYVEGVSPLDPQVLPPNADILTFTVTTRGYATPDRP